MIPPRPWPYAVCLGGWWKWFIAGLNFRRNDCHGVLLLGLLPLIANPISWRVSLPDKIYELFIFNVWIFFNLLKSMWICSTHVGKVSDLIIKNSNFTNITKLPCFSSRNVKNKPGVECLTSNATITCKINKYFFPYCSWVFICLVMIRYFTAHDN